MDDHNSAETLELLQALIRNECVNTGLPESGHEARSVATLADFFGATGEERSPLPGRTSVVYRVPGRDAGAPSLMLMGHLDVVPVTPSGWSVDPFAGEVADGMVWGRGTVDMLNVTASMAVVFRRYLTGQLAPPPGDLIFLAVADEEAGGVHGAGWLIDEHPDLVRCDYQLTEIAYPPLRSGAGELVYPVKVGEKGPRWRRIAAAGTPAHGSSPYGTDNALVKAARVIAAIADGAAPVAITDEWRAFVAGLELPAEQAAALTDPELVDAEIERIADGSPGFASYVHACTHLTLSPNVATGGTKLNTVADSAEAQVDIRTLTGQDELTVDDHLRKILGRVYDDLQITPESDYPANSSPTDGPLWDAIGDGFELLTGSRRVVPAITPATTDARFFRRSGTRSYGVGWFDDTLSFDEFLAMFHGNDERVSVASLGMTTQLLATVVERFGERARVGRPS
jgi:acetylornithine deacetylase/succinyl-diaminopimelate desuccinylase-like protein